MSSVSHGPPIASAARWSCARVARLGFLVGRGCDHREIAADARVAATPKAVLRKAQRLGLAFRAASGGARLPDAILVRYEAAAARRGLDRDALIHRILLTTGSDDALIDNILDDEA